MSMNPRGCNPFKAEHALDDPIEKLTTRSDGLGFTLPARLIETLRGEGVSTIRQAAQKRYAFWNEIFRTHAGMGEKRSRITLLMLEPYENLLLKEDPMSFVQERLADWERSNPDQRHMIPLSLDDQLRTSRQWLN